MMWCLNILIISCAVMLGIEVGFIWLLLLLLVVVVVAAVETVRTIVLVDVIFSDSLFPNFRSQDVL